MVEETVCKRCGNRHITAEELKKAKLDKGYSYEGISDETGYSKYSIYRYVKGIRPITCRNNRALTAWIAKAPRLWYLNYQPQNIEPIEKFDTMLKGINRKLVYIKAESLDFKWHMILCKGCDNFVAVTRHRLYCRACTKKLRHRRQWEKRKLKLRTG